MAHYCNVGIETNAKILNAFDCIYQLKEDDQKAVAKAWFNTARFYNKFFAPSREQQLKHTQQALEYYEKVIEFYEKSGKIWLATDYQDERGGVRPAESSVEDGSVVISRVY